MGQRLDAVQAVVAQHQHHVSLCYVFQPKPLPKQLDLANHQDELGWALDHGFLGARQALTQCQRWSSVGVEFCSALEIQLLFLRASAPQKLPYLR